MGKQAEPVPSIEQLQPDIEPATPSDVQQAIDGLREELLAELNGRMEGVSGALNELDGKLQGLITSLEAKAEHAVEAGGEDLAALVHHAHAKIAAIVTAVERAIGIDVSKLMPAEPGATPEATQPEMIGAETLPNK